MKFPAFLISIPFLFSLVVIILVELAGAFRADAVAELGVGMGTDVILDLIPIAFVVSDFFAGRANGEKAA